MSDSQKPTGSISLPADFHFGQIDSMPTDHPARAAEALAFAAPAPPPSLGPLAAFTGAWIGAGFNTIFRPENTVTPTPLPNPVPPSPLPIDNLLELNITSEKLVFSPSLGAVPNRGTQPQGDIQLNGVPYLQSILDVTTGIGIHAEPGLWMNVPPTTVPPEITTVTRMASIPHGTTINAQGTSTTTAGGPAIPTVSITPFTIGGSQAANAITFASQTAADPNTRRLPQDLKTFIAAGTITQAILDDPNLVLSNISGKQTITSTTQIDISTNPGIPIFGGPPVPATPAFGGGADNIAFLLGDAAVTKPNANAIQMEATFWIETVETSIVVPPFNPGDAPLLISPAPVAPGQVVPQFVVNPTTAIPAAITIAVSYTQIQYSQTVLLVFANLNWPHVSVATLVPADPVPVPDAAFSSPPQP